MNEKPYWERQKGWGTDGNCLTCGEAGRCHCPHPKRGTSEGQRPVGEHTPTPEIKVDAKNGLVRVNGNWLPIEFVVRAVNAHAELLGLCKSSLEGWNRLLAMAHTGAVRLDAVALQTIRNEVVSLKQAVAKAEGRE